LTSAIIFDFDYTLADSSPAVIACVAYAFERMGLPPVTDDAVRATIGLSLPNTLADLAGERQRARADEFRGHFRRLSDQIMVERTSLLPFVPTAIHVLRERGTRLAIVSTKFRCRIEDVLARDGLAAPFEVIIGGDDVSEFKPSPEGLLAAVERMQQSSDQILYVGDSITDAETARRANVPFAAVLSGTTPAAAFEAFAPVEIFEDVSAIPAWLGEH
jgi:phosphoglycolate phosphatase